MRAQRPWLLLGLILGLGAMVAVACGGGDEGITKAELEAALAAAAQPAPAPAPAAPSAAEISALVSAAVAAAAPPGVSSADVAAAVEAAVASAVASAAGEAVTAAEIEALVSKAVEDAVSGGPTPLTSSQVEAIVSSAIAAIPTPAPPPPPAPVPAAPPPPPAPMAVATPAYWNPPTDVYGQPVYGGHIRINYEDPLEHANLWGAHSGVTVRYRMPTMNSLVAEDPYQAGRIIPDLAQSWTNHDDLTGVTFEFEDGISGTTAPTSSARTPDLPSKLWLPATA